MPNESELSDVGEREAEVHHRSVFSGHDADPAMELVNIVAELRGVDRNELGPLYSWIDSLVEDLYSSPPPAEAQATVEFSYEGFRITLYQDGHAVFMDRDES